MELNWGQNYIYEQGALEHNTRKMIYNHILTYPGVSFSIIKNMFNLNDSTLRYHLNYLENRNEIKSTMDGRNKCYYPVQNIIFSERAEGNVGIYKLNETQERILEVIRRNPDISQKELIIRSGLKKFTVKYNLRKLVNFGVIQKKNNGRSTNYRYITDTEVKKQIMKRLVVKLLNHEIDEHTFLNLKRKLEE